MKFPEVFLVEVAIRMIIVYIILVVSMRLLGKRMSGQLTRNETAALVSLAAAVGMPVLAPDRGILPAIIISIVVVTVSRVTVLLSIKNPKAEMITHGSISTLVTNGVMNVKEMEHTGLTQERIMAQLRSEQIRHLGQVDRLFFEANGSFTLIKSLDKRPGLSALPDGDEKFQKEFQRSEQQVCRVCGNPMNKNSNDPCSNCGHKNWVTAVKD